MNSITPANVTQPEWDLAMKPLLWLWWQHPGARASDAASPTAGDLDSPTARGDWSHADCCGLSLPEHPLVDDHLLRVGGLDLHPDQSHRRHLSQARRLRLWQGGLAG